VLQLGGVAIDAISVGGLETSIGLPGLKLAFDLGVCRPQAVALPTVLFTHAHIDHMGALVQHCATRSLMGMRPPTYAFPQENLGGVEDLLRAWRRPRRAPCCRSRAGGGPWPSEACTACPASAGPSGRPPAACARSCRLVRIPPVG
jgi:hypothetical protein